MPSPNLVANQALLKQLSELASVLDREHKSAIDGLAVRYQFNALMQEFRTDVDADLLAARLENLNHIINMINSPEPVVQDFEGWRRGQLDGYESMHGTSVQQLPDVSEVAYARYKVDHDKENALKSEHAKLITDSSKFSELVALQKSLDDALIKERKYEAEQKIKAINDKASALMTGLITAVTAIKANVEKRMLEKKSTDPTRLQEVEVLLNKLNALNVDMSTQGADRKYVANALREISLASESISSSLYGKQSSTAKELLALYQAEEYQDYRSSIIRTTQPQVNYSDILNVIKQITHNFQKIYGTKAGGDGVIEILSEVMHPSRNKEKYDSVQRIAQAHLDKRTLLGNPIKRDPDVQQFYFLIKKQDLVGLRQLEKKTHPQTEAKVKPPRGFDPHNQL